MTQITPNRVLRSLFLLRTYSIAVLASIIAVVEWGLSLPIPIFYLLVTIFGVFLWNLLSWWRLQQDWMATQLEVFLCLAIDLLFISTLLYLTGGATNPFVSIFLLIIAVGAIALNAFYTWGLTLISIALYSLLMFFFLPIPQTHQLFGGEFEMHFFGMWVNFVLSALFMAVFITSVALLIRKKDQALSEHREEILRNEQILALGTLSASVAHELNTPLSTIKLLVEELQQQTSDPQLTDDANLIGQQVDVCQLRIKSLLNKSSFDNSQYVRISLTALLDEVIDQWRLIRPELELLATYQSNPSILKKISSLALQKDPSLIHALINLLNNAGDASLENSYNEITLSVDIQTDTHQSTAVIEVRDFGKGLSSEQKEQVGNIFFSSKGGLGIGFALSNATINRFNGDVELLEHGELGCITRINIPVSAAEGGIS